MQTQTLLSKRNMLHADCLPTCCKPGVLVASTIQPMASSHCDNQTIPKSS